MENNSEKMIVKVRKGVFESASSSVHSVCIPEILEDNMLDFTSLVPNDEDEIRLTGGDFGWEIEEYTDANTKANYMAVYVSQNYPTSVINEVLLSTILSDVIQKQTGAKKIVLDVEGYIDHQSVEDQDYHWLFEEPETLRNFIFNRGALLLTDNDNH